MEKAFRKYVKDGFNHFLYASGHACYNKLECLDEFEEKYLNPDVPQEAGDFRSFLYLLSFLGDGHEKFIVMRYTPELMVHPFIRDCEDVSWKYRVLADDVEGIGVDKGYVKRADGTHCMVVPADSITILEDFPEDMLGDDQDDVDIYVLPPGKRGQLLESLRSGTGPDLKNLLEDGGMFANMIYGKVFDHFNAFLIKTREEGLEEKIFAYSETLSSGN